MNLRNLIVGVKQAGIGIFGEILTYVTYGIMDGESQTYIEANKLSKAYTLQGIGKIFNNKNAIYNGIQLEKEARDHSKKRSELFKSIRGPD